MSNLANNFIHCFNSGMKINQNTYTPKVQFKAGLTRQMQSEIKHCDPVKISSELAKIGIPSDFKNNKVIAWCSLKCTEIINNINQKYKLHLNLPKGIFVEEFSELLDVNPAALATCNISRDRLHPNSKKVTKEQTILVNQFLKENPNFWDEIDQIADENYEYDISPTSHFLDLFLHEFCHSLHEGHMIDKIKFIPTLLAISETMDDSYIEDFQNKLGDTISERICEYATESPMETIACDLTKRIITSLDPNTLEPSQNFTQNSPYKHSKLNTKDYLEAKLNRFWNGNFKI